MRGYEYETNGYHRAMEDEYEGEYYDQDEYEEEGSGAGEEYVEEEEEPPEGQQEFLQIRERLKEQIRRRAQGASTAGRSSSSHDRKPPTNFGSFFGPSKPVISQRVIEERKSMKELQSTMSRDRIPSGKDIPSSSKVQAKTNGLHQKRKIVNEAKRKAEALKDNRDYSFLLSDDAGISSSPKEKPAARSSFTQKSDRELTHSAVKSRAPASQPARLSDGYGLKNKSSTQRHAESKVDSKRKEAFPNRERTVSLDNGRMRSVVRNGSSQATTSKVTSQKIPSKGPIINKHSMKDVNDQPPKKNNVPSKHLVSQNERPQSSQSQRMQSASHGQRPHQSVQSQRLQQSLPSRKPQQLSQSQRPQQLLQSQKPQQSLQKQRPQQSSQGLRPQSQSYRLQSSQGQRPLSSQSRYSEQRRVQANDRVKPVERQLSRQISSNGIRDVHAKKKQPAKRRFDDEIEDEEDALAMIRSMFRYDPSKYAGKDEDDSDMEADFATIEREEKRSARIARQEDEEQLRLIEEEEKREQERKRRRLAHGR